MVEPENLFDLDDDPISRDFEYTPAYGWIQEVFDFKLETLRRGLIELADDSGLDLLGCCEIEKDTLLQQLLDRAGLGLQAVVDVDATSDLRGIDTAMAFNPDTLEVRFTATHLVHLRYATRDILEVGFRVRATGEEFVAVASHWPSRRLGRYRSDPLRIAVAEQIAYIVQRHVKLDGAEYEAARAANDLARVQAVWETPIIIMGDFNDEPADRSVVDHLCASSELDRVIGETNVIDRFKKETADYRATDVFLYNPMWRFLHPENVGT
jgi:Endonuclease/Exonuclease/phosphatase family